MRREINPSKEYERLTRSVLSKIDVSTATQTDIIKFLDSLRKPEVVDPMHKWIGSYNLYVAILKRFFKWFNNPYCMEGIKKIKRKEVSIYKPSDLWTQEDDLLFLKFCPSKRDKCYHMISRDTSCRPSEILRIKCKEIVFKMIGNRQYAEVLVNGKTGSRHIPLINSLPYVKDYLDDHVSDPNSYLIRSKKFGKLNSSSLNVIYTKYKEEYFPRLLKDPNVSKDDKDAIRALLAKPWNPYIRRHSALTEKSKILKEHILRSHAGWSSRSNMPERYLHYFGNESSESILEAYGLKPSVQESDRLSPVQCPNCGEGNRQQSRFCSKCRMILSYDSYIEIAEQKEQQTDKIADLENTMKTILQTLVSKGVLEPTNNKKELT
jgi:integrase/recombinase XerD